MDYSGDYTWLTFFVCEDYASVDSCDYSVYSAGVQQMYRSLTMWFVSTIYIYFNLRTFGV